MALIALNPFYSQSLHNSKAASTSNEDLRNFYSLYFVKHYPWLLRPSSRISLADSNTTSIFQCIASKIINNQIKQFASSCLSKRLTMLTDKQIIIWKRPLMTIVKMSVQMTVPMQTCAQLSSRTPTLYPPIAILSSCSPFAQLPYSLFNVSRTFWNYTNLFLCDTLCLLRWLLKALQTQFQCFLSTNSLQQQHHLALEVFPSN